MNILLILIFIFWSIVVIKNTLFWVYLWQLKEYRIDRMRAHFELKTSKKLVFNRRILWLLIILLGIAIPILSIWATIALLLLYGLFAIRGLQQLQTKNLKLPRFTLRALLVLGINLTLYATIAASIFFLARTWFLYSLILGDILIIIIASFGVGVTHPIFSYLKTQIIKKATKKRAKFSDLLVIGITGSYGKSSMKEILDSMLSEHYNVLKTPQNINVDIGIARIILKKLNKDHDIFIAEMGAYRKGEILKTANMTKPQIGILTGINSQHLSLFKSFENIKEAKYELIESLKGKGLAVFNGDNEHVRALAHKYKKAKRVYAIDPLIDRSNQKILVEQVKNTPNGLEIRIKEVGGEEQLLKTSLLGKHNATNIVGAVTVARELDVSYKEIKNGLQKLKILPHTISIKRGIKNSIVIDDSYSANVNGALAALDVLATTKGRQKICILQPLVELGGSAEKEHAKIATKIAEVCTWCIITSKDYFNIIYKEVLDNGMSKDSIFCLPNPHDALRKAQELTDKDDVILIENRVPKRVINGLMLRSSK